MTTHTDSSPGSTLSAPPPRRLRRLLPRLVPAAALLVLGAAACASAGSSMDPAGPPAAGPLAGAPQPLQTSLDTLTEPMEVVSRNGVLDVTIAAVFKDLTIPGQPRTSRLRTYQVLWANGIDYADSAKYGFPGPTLRAFPGDSIHIVLLNQMWDSTTSPANPPSDTSNSQCASYPGTQGANPTDHFESCFHGVNWTNIHYHGMHVTPDANGDDVLKLIPPGASYEYGFRIPGNQSAGTHWYHPHKHGSVAIQVMNGMSGALIVDGGPLDTVADAHRMRERMIAVQQIDTLPNLMTPSTFGEHFFVNGKITPVIVMAPGEVQRWRIVNENVTKTNNFQFVVADSSGQEPSFYEIARDGVAYADTNYAPSGVPVPDPIILLAPGNRLDLFVQAPANAGIFSVHAAPVAHEVPQDQTRKESIGRRPLRAGADPRANVTAAAPSNPPLFYVQVDPRLPSNGSTLPARLPALPGFLANLPGPVSPAQILADTANLAVIVFADSAFSTKSHGNPTKFFLGTWQDPKQQFHSSVTYVPQTPGGRPLPMRLDSVQTWMVVNNSPATNHPFHIHINPFQVVDVFYPNRNDPNAALYAQLDSAAQLRGAPIWLDVVPLPLPRLDTLELSSTPGGPFDIIQVDTTPGYVLIRQAYQPFENADGTPCLNCGDPSGWFVMHCHILGHEERGMMQVIQIVAPGQQPAPPPPGAASGHGGGAAAAANAGRGNATPPGRGHRH